MVPGGSRDDSSIDSSQQIGNESDSCQLTSGVSEVLVASLDIAKPTWTIETARSHHKSGSRSTGPVVMAQVVI